MIRVCTVCYNLCVPIFRLFTTMRIKTALKRACEQRKGLGSIRGYFGLNILEKLNAFVYLVLDNLL